VLKDVKILELKAYFDKLYSPLTGSGSANTDASFDFGTITSPSTVVDLDMGTI
jgi:hypothetical protein